MWGCAGPVSEAPREHPAIVSLNPCTDAILAEVAEPAQILALSHYSHDPRASSMPQAMARRFAATGGTVEEVLALDPDVVLAGSYLPPASRAAMERFGIRVELFGVAATVAAGEAQVRRLARLAGRADRGEALVARIEHAVESASRPGPKVSTLLWQRGGIVLGPDALATQLLERTGFANHAASRGLGQGDHLPLEQLLADPPELILTAGGEGALKHPALSRLAATRYERLDPALTYCAGPSIIRLSARLAQIRDSLP